QTISYLAAEPTRGRGRCAAHLRGRRRKRDWHHYREEQRSFSRRSKGASIDVEAIFTRVAPWIVCFPRSREPELRTSNKGRNTRCGPRRRRSLVAVRNRSIDRYNIH